MDLNNDPPHQLTDPAIKVIGFDASRDGEFIMFYSVNAQNGIDLWRVSRTGGDAAVLLDCGRDRCTAPAISPERYACGLFTRSCRPRPGSALRFAARLAPRYKRRRKNSPVYQDQQTLGYNPVWSPDGTQLASYDGIADQVRVLNVGSGQQFIFSSNTGGPVTWSPDGTKFLFTDAVQNESGCVRVCASRTWL